MDSDMSELVVEEPNISAIALDWVHSNLYWASADRYNTDDSLHNRRKNEMLMYFLIHLY